MKKKIIALLLAGGVGSRLSILAKLRAKPAIPFGGIYRIIDFTMSNIANSNIDVVGVLTQYKPLSLMEHIDNGRPWDLFGRTRFVEILPPKTGEESSDWYKGTSDAIYQNIGFIEDFSPEEVLIVSGDHIYYMNYNELKIYHREKKADVTIALIRVPISQAHHFGVANINKDGAIIDWEEKPEKPKFNLASMGIYIFKKNILIDVLKFSAKKGGTDFAKDVIPILLKENKVFGYVFNGYWRDVGTIDAYWNTNMDLLRKDSGLEIEKWNIRTNLFTRGEIGDRPPAFIGKNAKAINSLVSRGCVVEGRVVNSIISPNVVIEKDSIVIDSVVFQGVNIKKNVLLKKVIVDKDVVISNFTKIGLGKMRANELLGENLNTGITVIGKGAILPEKMVIGKNCLIYPGVIIGKEWDRTIISGRNVG